MYSRNHWFSRRTLFMLLGLFSIGVAPVMAVAELVPMQLRCEYRENPLGIDVVQPRLGWVLDSTERGAMQTAYQVLVASTPEILATDQGDLWDSGRVVSDQSTQVVYQGKPLASRMACCWKVRAWDKDGVASTWSAGASWTMGLLTPGDWQAAWIKPAGTDQSMATAPWVRKEFTLAAVPGRAVAYVNVMGYYELYVNGQKAGDDVLAPAVSDYKHRSFYTTHDIGKFLRPGANCVGLWLGRGWNKSTPMARVQIDMSVNGQRVTVGTDRTWTAMASTHSLVGKWAWNEFGGECVDARRAILGWNEPECATGTWTPAEEVAAPQAEVTAQACPRNRIGQVIPMVVCTALGANTWELDFGTNLTGWLRLRLPQLNPGEKVVMSYADKRFQSAGSDDTPAGKIGPASTPKTVETPKGPVSYQTFNQFDEFISAGKTGEQFCSKFNYHGFRYVIVEGLPAPPAPGDAEALLIESDLEPAGDFACSNDLFNRIHQVNQWTLRNLNLGGYMVDCPHRERLGYGDGQVGIESQVMNVQAAAFYGKWAVDWLDAQKRFTGEMPHTAPDWGGGGGPAWGGTGCVLPWKLYLYYGDQRLLEHAYESMRRYVAFLEEKCKDGVMRHYGGEWDFIGDWVPPGRGMDTNNWPSAPAAELFNNCYRVYLWQILERSARALGKTQDAESCAAKLTELRPLIHAAFYDAQKQRYVLDEQSYQVMPLLTGIVPDDLRGTIQKKLEDLILVKGKGHLDTGMLGTYFLIQHLQETGRNDLLHTLFNQTTYPGWGYMLSQGATTFWEQWNGYWSQIHSCFTSPGGWFYQGLAGIRPDASAPGFKKIVIAPAVVGDLTWAKCSYNSIHGRIVSNWRRDGDTLSLEVTIPANTTAMVSLPGNGTAPSTIQESGKTVWSNSAYAGGISGITGASVKADCVDIAIGAGTYHFLVTGRG